jgi:hypothetical protein
VPGLFELCLGGTVFTSRRGFWEALSARVGEGVLRRYAGLVKLTETEKLLERVPRGEIFEFAKVVLECTFGAEWCEELRIGIDGAEVDIRISKSS